MRRSFTLLLFSLLIHQLSAQFVDDFTDGDFTSNPAWGGQTDRFSVESGQLRLTAPEVEDESYLVTASEEVDDVIWEFRIRMEFNPSSSNYSRVYLMSSASDLLGTLNGYFVIIGDSPDEVSLYRQDGSSEVKIIDGEDKTIDVSPVNVFVRVTRDALGNWELYRNGNLEGVTTDNTYSAATHFGVRCTYTSSRHDLFFFDDFFVGQDTSPPTISSIDVISQSEIDVTFSENVDQTTAETIGNYSIAGGISVSSASLDGSNSSLVHLTTSPLTNGVTQTLTVSGVEDEAGNAITSAQAQFQYLVFSEASFRDVQINEFLSDPTPSVGLPEVDFVELFNHTTEYFDLGGWRISDNSGNSGPMNSFTLSPGAFVIICDEDNVEEFQSFGSTIGVSSFPNFNSTTADAVIVIDDVSTIIDQVNYSGSTVASDGISNEQVNPDLICSGDFNFKPSEAADGGTPGTENSVLMIVQDGFAPELVGGRALTADSVRLDFDEFLNAGSVEVGDFSISPSVSITDIYLLDEYPGTVFLKLGEDIQENTNYTATASGISDCSGNSSAGSSTTFLLGIRPEDDDILLSEILFNPVSGTFDFVEIYNPSGTENFELRGWKLARMVDGEIDDPTPIAEEGLIIAPGAFYYFCAEAILSSPDGTFIELATPSYNDDEGTVLLLNADDEIVQQFDFLDDYHYALLEDEEGVSLERVSYTAPVNDPNNWRSAASTAGFQTPGRANSQSITQTESKGKLTIEPKVFLPGNSGSGRDFTTINYEFNQGGQFANVMVYDQSGRPVKQLANGASLATSGFIRWDGETDRGGMARMGYYVVVFEVYNGNGKTETLKETVVVGRDF